MSNQCSRNSNFKAMMEKKEPPPFSLPLPIPRIPLPQKCSSCNFCLPLFMILARYEISRPNETSLSALN